MHGLGLVALISIVSLCTALLLHQQYTMYKRLRRIKRRIMQYTVASMRDTNDRKAA